MGGGELAPYDEVVSSAGDAEGSWLGMMGNLVAEKPAACAAGRSSTRQGGGGTSSSSDGVNGGCD